MKSLTWAMHMGHPGCKECEMPTLYCCPCSCCPCSTMLNKNQVFKKSTKSFEK